MTPLTGRRWWLAVVLVFLVALAVIVPSVDDPGLTYDEPAYRYSQMLSSQWWELIGRGEFAQALDSEALLYYWPYGRYGINFHPPLAGQLNSLTYSVFGGALKDIPARRMASAIEFALTATLLFGFLARRSGGWVGIVAAGSLLLMPRVVGQARLIDTDTPGLLLWAAASCAFWRGLNDPEARGSRVAVGVLVGLAFVEKMGAVMVVGPMLLWLAARFVASLRKADVSWRSGAVTSFLMLAPLAVAYVEIRRLAAAFLKFQAINRIPTGKISPKYTNLFREHPATWIPGAILLAPLVVWLIRAAIRRRRPHAPQPALEIWLSLLAFGPAIAWLGNPAWWREALPRLAHYYAITTTRRGVLPDIQVMYFGQIYEFSLPWPNALVLIAITVPASILIASLLGLIFAPWRQRLPVFFLANLAMLPVVRMLPTPAHDGVRLFLPTFFYLAAFAGWGTIGLAGRLRSPVARPILATLVLVPAAWILVRIHPYELSYYNELIGGPRGAWKAGFELSYWYDSVTDGVLADLNAKLPKGARVMYANAQSDPQMIPQDLQALGALRGDILWDSPDDLPKERGPFPYVLLLTHDSKADGFTRLLYAMTPWYASTPKQLDGLRVVTVDDPAAVSRAWALQLLIDKPDRSPPDPPAAPAWVRRAVPPLARFWGDGVTKAPRLGVEATALDWGRSDPESLRAAADDVVAGRDTPGARRISALLDRYPPRARFLLRVRPEALKEAVEIIIRRPDALRRVLLRAGYTDPAMIGGPLDAG